jgi:tetratricopeptide (TPR) repeat protein
MKKYIIKAFSIVCLLFLTVGCESFTEIKPKGSNLLGTVGDLNRILNYPHSGSSFAEMPAVLVNDLLPSWINIADLVASDEVEPLQRAYYIWDETADRIKLTLTDNAYTACYSTIGKVANPVILNADNAVGDRKLANQYKAEAYVLRAYHHYIAVNYFAKAYDPATADTDGGIAYSFEDDDLAQPKVKRSVKEVYDYILADIQSALDLNSLPDEGVNYMRVGKSFLYAVKAKVLMSMRDYAGAEAAADESLAINGTIDNYNDMLVEGYDMYGGTFMSFERPELVCKEDLFYSMSSFNGLPATQELLDSYEEGSVLKEYMATDVDMFGFRMLGPMFYGLDMDIWFPSNVFISQLGLTTVDMYLTKAECLIRKGDISEAMNVLNTIRVKRVVPEKYQPKTASNATEAFAILKDISRCENFATTKTYINIKRWNREGTYKETLKKTVLGKEYTLSPDSPLWIFPFPSDVTAYNPNLTQNY